MKTKIKIIFWIFVIVLLLISGCGKEKIEKEADFKEKIEVSCYEEGTGFDQSTNPEAKCCSSLTQIRDSYPVGEECKTFDKPIYICINCGDGKCETERGENRCNCKEDCEK